MQVHLKNAETEEPIPTSSKVPLVPSPRGFPHAFTENPRFAMILPQRVDLRFALLLPSVIQIPTGVRDALRYERCRHVTSESGRCAAFALGSRRLEHKVTNWYIMTLQSDLAFTRRAVLKDFVRGCLPGLLRFRGLRSLCGLLTGLRLLHLRCQSCGQRIPKGAGLICSFHGGDFEQQALP